MGVIIRAREVVSVIVIMGISPPEVVTVVESRLDRAGPVHCWKRRLWWTAPWQSAALSHSPASRRSEREAR